MRRNNSTTCRPLPVEPCPTIRKRLKSNSLNSKKDLLRGSRTWSGESLPHLVHTTGMTSSRSDHAREVRGPPENVLLKPSENLMQRLLIWSVDIPEQLPHQVYKISPVMIHSNSLA